MTQRLPHLNAHLPSTAKLLTLGGDERIELDANQMTNKYGRKPIPDREIFSFGSATASTISDIGFSAAERLRQRILQTFHGLAPEEIYLEEIDRVRNEFVRLCGLEHIRGMEVIVSPSGTDAHMLASKLVAGSSLAKTLAIMVQPEETGSGVGHALAGGMHHESGGITVNSADPIDVRSIAVRTEGSRLRPIAALDDELEAIVSAAITRYSRILIVLTDVSKTGVLAPTPSKALDLRRRWPDSVEILVDASQFRLAPKTLQTYLTIGCLVIVTGSKFLGGPAFSAMLLVPESLACRLKKRPLRPMPGATCCRADWPRNWTGAQSLPETSNFGLLLRWEAALAELRAFRSVSEEDIQSVVFDFHKEITSWLNNAPNFQLLEQPNLQRHLPIAHNSWDQIPTIFPFLLFQVNRRATRNPLSAPQTKRIYDHLCQDLTTKAKMTGSKILAAHCEVGQPVPCGELEGVQVAALRLCLSARLIVEAINAGERGIERLFERGLMALEKVAFLTRN
ncbi:hypothetical protein [Sinorhizobium psoraleae]|uniref:Uncharacterized protein n=1 Tax=Sinorhizobium psoraleae TaxID=520838 RepID=A0ABT4KN23_9HYPH|nr:hypothetical protein [Sinorhizobium psoraleae]MCZ4093249.1 hypothetical protein [Sinorhizobium psoraleae]